MWDGRAQGTEGEAAIPASASELEELLDRLVRGMTGLSADGRFHEPNLDGTPGDYVSFDAWEWPQGVGLLGLVRLAQVRRDASLRRTVEDWYARHLARGLPPLNVNTTAPMLALALLWRETREPRWQAPLGDWADRSLRDLPRTGEAGFQHDVSDRINMGELWDDTLFMVALFLASFGETAGRPEYRDEAIRQFLVHARFLADPASGLWFHGWTFAGRHNFARARWARGNAWITVGILELLDLATVPAPVRAYLLGILDAQMRALIALQRPSGAWGTLLDDPSSYDELSATAGFACGLLRAARLGTGPEGARAAGLRALDAVVANIGPDGLLRNVSYGTRMGHDLQFYRDIPLQPTGYGQALAILALTEGLILASTGGSSS